MSDLISRQQALSTIEANQGTLNKRRVMKILEGLPSAQHENKRQATVSSDCISRKDAIRDIRSMDVCVMYDDMCSTEEAVEKAIVATKRTAIFGLECMPSAQPEIIRCKDCRHGVDYYHEGDCYCLNPKYGLMYFGGSWEFYCADAERRNAE